MQLPADDNFRPGSLVLADADAAARGANLNHMYPDIQPPGPSCHHYRVAPESRSKYPCSTHWCSWRDSKCHPTRTGCPQTTAPITADDARLLRYTVPAPSALTVARAQATRSVYAEEAGRLNYFKKSSFFPPFPDKRFIPEDTGVFKKIRDSDRHNGWEVETLWNIRENHENLLAAFHGLANALVSKDLTLPLEAFAVANHYALSAHERVQERIDFFSDWVESGKSEALLLQRYFREEDQPYVFSTYRTTKQKVAELRIQVYAKDFNKQTACDSETRSIKGNNQSNRSADSRTSK